MVRGMGPALVGLHMKTTLTQRVVVCSLQALFIPGRGSLPWVSKDSDARAARIQKQEKNSHANDYNLILYYFFPEK